MLGCLGFLNKNWKDALGAQDSKGYIKLFSQLLLTHSFLVDPEIIFFYSIETPENQIFRADKIIFMFTLVAYFR